jgi:hypothetical protein
VTFGNLDNYGKIEWSGGDICLKGALVNKTGGEFIIRRDNTTLDEALNAVNPKIINHGTFTKAVSLPGGPPNPDPKTVIKVPFENSGQFNIFTTLELTQGGTQTGPPAATTAMKQPAAKLIAPTYSILTGTMWGEGNFYGNLTNGGTLHLGRELGVVGTLTVHGDYNQTQGATFFVEYSPGGVGTLIVTTNDQGGGGTANINGNIKLRRVQPWAPAAATVTFLQSVTLQSNINQIHQSPTGSTRI